MTKRSRKTRVSAASLAAFKAHRSRALLRLKATRKASERKALKARIAEFDAKLAALTVAG